VRKAAPARPPAFSWPADWPRPTRLLPAPEPIETVALLPDAPPASFTWRGLRRRVRAPTVQSGCLASGGRPTRAGALARLLPGRGRGRRALLDLRDGDGEDAATGSQRWFMARGVRMSALKPLPYDYVELQCASHFSLLRGASRRASCSTRPSAWAIEALAICDRNSVAGIVRAHVAAKATGVRLIVGCELVLRDGMSLVVLPTDRPPMAGCAGCCRWARPGPARASATWTWPTSPPMPKA
jgi:hypothetical protein